MCLIIFAIDQHPEYPFILAANRDEFFERPTAPVDRWDEYSIIGGRDLKAGGTWMGVNGKGRLAAVTNYRDPAYMGENALSRGDLPVQYLKNDQSAFEYLNKIAPSSQQYNGFNLLVRDDHATYHFSNVNRKINVIPKGIHGLSNHLLNTPWPKVEKGKSKLQKLILDDEINDSALFELLMDKQEARDNALPSTGVSYELEKKLSSMFIRTKGYGTRCSTIVLIDQLGNGTIREKTFDESENEITDRQFSFAGI